MCIQWETFIEIKVDHVDLEEPQSNQDSFAKGESWGIHMTWFENLMQSHGQSSVAPQQHRDPEAKSYLCDVEFSTGQRGVRLSNKWCYVGQISTQKE